MLCRKCKAEIDATRFCPHCGSLQEKPNRNTKKRGNGQGSIYKRGSTWCVQLTEWVNGERITKYKGGFKTKSEATAYVPVLREQQCRKPGMTLHEAFAGMMERNDTLSHNTIKVYETAFNKLKPIWDADLQDITIERLQQCIDESSERKGPRQVLKTVIGLVYKYALPRYPELRPLNLGSFLSTSGAKVSDERPAFSVEQLERIRDAIGVIPYAEHVYCHCYLGFRLSAFITLKKSDYNEDEKAFVGGVKTTAGKNRTVTVSPKIQPYVDKLLKLGGETVFCNYNGKKFNKNSYAEKFAVALSGIGIENPVQDNGVKLYTPHTCRHTFATLMKRVDGSSKDKLALMGHANLEQLMDYQDVEYDDLRRITDRM